MFYISMMTGAENLTLFFFSRNRKRILLRMSRLTDCEYPNRVRLIACSGRPFRGTTRRWTGIYVSAQRRP